ncbi:MAG: zinc ribbon domain-containing protein [Elusimicrobia bacterium]|nr:zinc ribbon domain-containing protein [Elusimicrobiota bacterium]
MKCPNCAAEAPEGATDCPACGLVFAKWKGLQERKERDAASALAAAEAPPAPASNPWVGRGIALGVVAVWMLGLALFYRSWLAHVKIPEGVPTGEFVEVRDPVTGDMKRMPIRRVGAAPPPSSAPAVDGH